MSDRVPVTSALDEETARAEIYGVLSQLLYSPPAAPLLEAIRMAPTEAPAAGAFLEEPWREVVGAARAADHSAIAAEYDALFGGVGKPEVYLYGSHYLAGFLNERPLARLRGDLAALGLARAALALGHQGRQPVEGVQFDGEGPRRTGSVPWIGRGLHLHGGAGQDKAPDQQVLARGGIVRPEISRRRRKGRDLAPAQHRAQGQTIARKAVKLDPQLTGDQTPGDGGPKTGAGRRLPRPDGRADRRARKARNLARGDVRRLGLAPRSEGTQGAHPAVEAFGADFRAAILAA